jgi:hypothetical protein
MKAAKMVIKGEEERDRPLGELWSVAAEEKCLSLE